MFPERKIQNCYQTAPAGHKICYVTQIGKRAIIFSGKKSYLCIIGRREMPATGPQNRNIPPFYENGSRNIHSYHTGHSDTVRPRIHRRHTQRGLLYRYGIHRTGTHRHTDIPLPDEPSAQTDGGAGRDFPHLHMGRGRNQKKKDGEITVQQTETSSKKVVSNEVGDYVEYEDIREETSESRRE